MDSFDVDALDDEQQEEVTQREGFEAYRENLVFLIDASPRMFVKAELPDKDFGEGDTWFTVALKVTREVLMTRIIGSDNDQIAVVFYGTRESKNLQSFDHIYTALDLDVPDAHRIKELKDMIEQDTFEDTIGGEAEPSPDHLRHALWTASGLLSGASGKASKRIWIFTNDPDPTASTGASAGHYRDQIMSRAQDLRETKVALELYPMIAPDQPFLESGFWQHVLSLNDPEELAEYEGTNVAYRIQGLSRTVRRKAYKKRVLSSLRWHFGPGLELAVQLFAMIQPASKSAAIPLMAQTNEVVRSEAAFVCSDTGAVLTEWMHRFPKVERSDKPDAAERFPPILLTDDEKRALHTFASPGLRLLGFKPTSWLLDYYQLRNATFVYPDERTMSGSTAAFVAFHSKMLDLQQVALCSFIRNRNSEPRLVAMLAQEEVSDEYGAQVEPPGMQMIYLPYADDLREPEKAVSLVGRQHAKVTKASREVEAAEALIDALRLDDLPIVPNPVLERHWQMLEAFALDEDPTTIGVVDQTLPDAEGLQAAHDQIIAFRDLVYGEGVDDTGPVKKAPAEKKRKTPEEEAALAEAVAGTDYRGLAESGKLSTLTVANLQKYCQANSLPKSGKKADIIERILQHMGLNK